MKKNILREWHDEIMMIIIFIIGLSMYLWGESLPRYYETTTIINGNNEVEIVEEATTEITTKKDEPKAVRFTSYYIGDYSGSGATTSSGLGVDDFEVNENGWYTYNGKVVIASATYRCLNATTGACGKYNELPEGYNIYKIGDEITIFLNGNNYEAIILDSCGASFWEEDLQRYDIFVQDKASVYDGAGYILNDWK